MLNKGKNNETKILRKCLPRQSENKGTIANTANMQLDNEIHGKHWREHRGKRTTKRTRKF